MQNIARGSERDLLNQSASNKIPEEQIEKIGNSIRKNSDVYISVAFNWDLETVRSLVLTNLTGITAVGALAASKIDISSFTLYVTFALYGFGICSGIMDMHLATLVYQWRARNAIDALVEFINEKNFPALARLSKNLDARPPRRYMLVSWLGWISGVSFIVGTIFIIISLIQNSK